MAPEDRAKHGIRAQKRTCAPKMKGAPAIAGAPASLRSGDYHHLILDRLDARHPSRNPGGLVAVLLVVGGAVQRDYAIRNTGVDREHLERRVGAERGLDLAREHLILVDRGLLRLQRFRKLGGFVR